MGKVIAIDGPSGSGKGAISKLLAERLGFHYLDTGALYRAVALHLRRRGATPEADDAALRGLLEEVEVAFSDGRVFLNDEDVSEEIRTPEAGHYASVFSARPVVRDALFRVQRDAAAHCDIVAEGRDMTTVVFPDAWKKFYLDASEEARVERRYRQLKEKGMAVTLEEAREEVRERDLRDSRRDVAPLKRAEDAVYVDTTSLGIDEVVAALLAALAQPS